MKPRGLPLVYRDGVLIVAAQRDGAVSYAVSAQHGQEPRVTPDMVLDERTARELVAALTWILSEVEAKRGHASFRPREGRLR